MNIATVRPGRYVIAVSGGVDSMVLLDVMRQLPGLELIVAHVNHGIRTDATHDEQLVQTVAMSHNLVFVSTNLHLGSGVGEERARRERYDFLRSVCKKYNANAILTAHHRDDLIETAIINMLRGTGWRGLGSLRSTDEVFRPLLMVSKAELVNYAETQGVKWHHDSTNDDTYYMRNYVRHKVLADAPAELTEKLYQYIVRQNELTALIDDEAAKILQSFCTDDSPVDSLPRYEYTMIASHVAHELLQTVLRRKSGKSVPRPLAERALLFVKVAKQHKIFPIGKDWQLRALRREVIVEQRPAVVSLDNAGVHIGPHI